MLAETREALIISKTCTPRIQTTLIRIGIGLQISWDLILVQICWSMEVVDHRVMAIGQHQDSSRMQDLLKPEGWVFLTVMEVMMGERMLEALDT